MRPKTTLAAAVLRQAEAGSAAPLLAVFAGAYAVETVSRPCLAPQEAPRRSELVPRVRADARLDQPLRGRAPAKGRRPGGGARLAAPQHHVSWPVSWQRRRAWGYGRRRRCRDTQRRCRWAVRGPQIPVHVVVLEMAGEVAPWFLVTSAVDLAAAQVVEAWTARFRPADGVRDHKPRLGLEEGRAWTKAPMLRTLQVQLVTLTLLRLRPARLDQAWGPDPWWCKPAWNPHKRPASVLDLRRRFGRYRTEFSQCLVQLEALEKCPQPLPQSRDRSGRAA